MKLKTARRAPRFATAPAAPAKRPAAGLKFQRTFSHPTIAPFDEIEWEQRTAEITDDSGKVIFKQENVEVPKSWSALATKIAVSKYFYGDIAHGNDPYKRRPRALGAAAHPSRHAHDHRLRDQGRLLRRHGERGSLLQRTHLALREPVRRVQFAGLVQRRPLAPVQDRHGPRRGQLVLRSQARRRSPRPDAVRIPAGQRLLHPVAWTTTWKTSCASRMSEAMLFKYGSRHRQRSFHAPLARAKSSAAAASRAARSPS